MQSDRKLDNYPDLLTPEEAMTFLQIGRNSIYRLLRSGELKALRIGKQYRIPKKCLQMLIESCYSGDADMLRLCPKERS